MKGVSSGGGDTAGLAVIDPHAHYYAAYDPAAFLNAAHRNLSALSCAARFAGGAGSGTSPAFAVVLLDIGGRNLFADWRDGKLMVPGWTYCPLPEDSAAVRYKSAEGGVVTLIAGRQLVSTEGLEVVVIGTTEAIPDRLPVREYLSIYAHRWPLMLPWGVGKWLGRRGRLVSALLNEAGLPPFLLGDNAGRPRAWSGVAQFRRAAELGTPILPGSDPLPIRQHVGRVGCGGCVLPVDLSGSQPSQILIAALRAPRVSLSNFARHSSIGEFVRDQLVLRLDRVI